MNFNFGCLSRRSSTDQLIASIIDKMGQLEAALCAGPRDAVSRDRLLRGPTPADIEETALRLCRSYISGSWQRARPSELTVTRLRGALTNQLYRVQLPAEAPRLPGSALFKGRREPDDVVVKLYLSKYCKTAAAGEAERFEDAVMLAQLSQAGLTPPVHGVFEHGFLQDYVPHEHFSVKHQRDPAMLARLADLLARIHYLPVPTRKTDVWPLSEMDLLLRRAYTDSDLLELLRRVELKELRKHDLRVEMQDLRGWLRAVNSPMVFSHNDFIGANVLVVSEAEAAKDGEDPEDQAPEPGPRLLAVDFEYASYFARAYDLAVFHSQWGVEPFEVRPMTLPEDEVLAAFLQLYIDACERLEPGFKQKPTNSLTRLLRETKVYFLAYLLYNIIFALNAPRVAEEEVGRREKRDKNKGRKWAERNLVNADKGLIEYLAVKKRLVDDGSIRLPKKDPRRWW